MPVPPDPFTPRTDAPAPATAPPEPGSSRVATAPGLSILPGSAPATRRLEPAFSTETGNTFSRFPDASGIRPILSRLGSLLRPSSPFVRAVAFACLAAAFAPVAAREAVIVDHTYDLSKVPESALEAVRAHAPVVHFAHRSDGTAVPWGMRILDSRDHARFPYSVETGEAPPATRGLRFWDGMSAETYVTPDLYWRTAGGRRDLDAILRQNPEIRYTTWTFCDEDDSWTWSDDPAQNDYLRTMDSLEKAFPRVTFIYQTAAMRPVWNAEGNVNQARFNEGLRSWARRTGKVLFDFADLDVWHAGEHHTQRMTYTASNPTRLVDTAVEIQHPYWRENNGPTTGWHHANDSMGIDKARAWWYLMARLEADWTGTTGRTLRSPPGSGTFSVQATRAGWIVRGPAIASRAVLVDVGGRQLARRDFQGELALARSPVASAGLILQIVPGDGSAPAILRLPPAGL